MQVLVTIFKMQKLFKKYGFVFFILLLLNSCRKPACFAEAGSILKTTRVATFFNQIDIEDNINLVLTQDTAYKIFVEAGEHLAPNITTIIENGILSIRNETSCKWLRSPSEKINVHVSFKELIRIIYNGSGNITSTNKILADGITFFTDEGAGNIDIDLEAKRTYAYIFNDNTDMIFRGSSDSCYVYTGERGTIDFRNFVVKHQVVGYGSIRDGFVHATESLHVIMYFKGTLYYRGNPARVTTEFLSSGKVVRLP